MRVDVLKESRVRSGELAYAIMNSPEFDKLAEFTSHYNTAIEYELLHTEDFEAFKELRRQKKAMEMVLVRIKTLGEQYKRELESKAAEAKTQGEAE